MPFCRSVESVEIDTLLCHIHAVTSEAVYNFLTVCNQPRWCGRTVGVDENRHCCKRDHGSFGIAIAKRGLQYSDWVGYGFAITLKLCLPSR